jgi:hypothetical protein
LIAFSQNWSPPMPPQLPSTPQNCADTPTQTYPSRVNSVWAVIQSGAASSPPLTLSHSTITVPLNRPRVVGR